MDRGTIVIACGGEDVPGYTAAREPRGHRAIVDKVLFRGARSTAGCGARVKSLVSISFTPMGKGNRNERCDHSR